MSAASSSRCSAARGRSRQPALPVIGFLSGRSADDSAWLADAFRQGLKDTGFIEKQNVAIEYRWAGNRWERLDALAADLIRRQVDVIAALSYSPNRAGGKSGDGEDSDRLCGGRPSKRSG